LTRPLAFLLTDINEYFKHGISVAAISLLQERGCGNAILFASLFSGMLLLRGEEIFLTPWQQNLFR